MEVYIKIGNKFAFFIYFLANKFAFNMIIINLISSLIWLLFFIWFLLFPLLAEDQHQQALKNCKIIE